ncbi:hypothetical protein HGD85_00980 [Rhodobacteraceae bacterium R_SAG10]|nr:hypothetical protein [Rhodobacteraceae bacterium R_SAG10]
MSRSIVAVVLAIWSGIASAASPEDTAKKFLDHLIQGETFEALELVADIDRAFASPFGNYSDFIFSRPRFPSLWRIETQNVDETETETIVHILMRHPEIEESLRTANSPAIEEMALLRYFECNLPLSSTIAEIVLVPSTAGSWRVRTHAEDNAWQMGRMERFYLVKADVGVGNREEIEAFRDRLLEEFSERAAEIANLIEPELAILDAADGLRFQNLTFVDDRTRETQAFREPAYEVGFTVENVSKYSIGWIDVVLVFRSASGEVVDTSSWLFSEDDLPHGLAPGERYSTKFGRRIDNPGGSPTQIEVQIANVRLR